MSDAFGVGVVNHLAGPELKSSMDECLEDDDTDLFSVKTDANWLTDVTGHVVGGKTVVFTVEFPGEVDGRKWIFSS